MHPLNSAPINIGISVFSTPDAHIWDGGLNQHIAFLVLLLRQSPRIGKVYLLNGGDSDHLPPGLNFNHLQASLVRPHEVTHELDVVIEMGAQLPLEWLRHVRALGVKIVTFLVGNSYVSQCEGPMFGRPAGAHFRDTPHHEVWLLPQHEKTSLPLLKTLTRVPVHSMPHLWSPCFLDPHIALLQQQGHHFGYRHIDRKPTPPGWRVAIFEPNISVTKTCFVPMLVTEHAYRQQPDSVALMMVMNSFHMKEHLTFNRFASHLDLTINGKATYEPRLAFASCMVEHAMDAVVAHHWECGLNHAYCDALHGGYPLIHNSTSLQQAGVGFFYPGFSAKAGGQALADAWRLDGGFWDDYRRRSATYLQRLAPEHPDNIASFLSRLLHLEETDQ